AKDHDIKFYCSNDIKSKIKILDHKHTQGAAKNSQDNKVLRRERASSVLFVQPDSFVVSILVRASRMGCFNSASFGMNLLMAVSCKNKFCIWFGLLRVGLMMIACVLPGSAFSSFSTVFQAFLQPFDLFRAPDMELFLFVRHSDPPRGSNDSIDKLFDDGNDAGPEHPTVGDDDVLTETIGKDVLEVVEKTKKSKQKRKTTEDASVSTFPPKKLREDYHAATSNIDGKSLATIRSLISEGSSVSSEVGEPRDDGPTDSVSGLNLRTCSSMRYVVSSNDSYHSDLRSEVNSFARFPVADAPVMTVAVTSNVAADVYVVLVSKDRVRSENLEIFRDSTSAGRANANVASSSKLNEPATSSNSFYASQDLDFEALHRIYVPKWKVTNDSVLDDPMRAEHTLEQKDKLVDKCDEQAALLSKKDDEIANLKSLLSLKEDEAAKAIRLCGQLSVAKAADVAKGNELKGLKEKNLALEEDKSALSKKVTTLESVIVAKETELASLSGQVAKLTSNLPSFQLSRDELNSKRCWLKSAFELFKGCIEAMQDEQANVLGNRVAELDAQLLEMADHLEEEFYPRFLTTISGRQLILTHDGLKAGVDHGKTRRDLSMIEAYDPSVEAKYVDAVNDLRTVDFPLLSVLKSKKDACMIDLIDSIHLEGPLDEIPRAEELQPSLEQLMLPIHMVEDDVVLGDTSLSFSLQVVHSQVQRVKGEIMKKCLSLTDVMVPLVEPLSSKSLIGEASTSAISATVGPIICQQPLRLSVLFLFFQCLIIKSWIRNHMMKTLLS
nr:hypothetical protein [Tanacetum cinerariifolium]